MKIQTLKQCQKPWVMNGRIEKKQINDLLFLYNNMSETMELQVKDIDCSWIELLLRQSAV